MFSPLFSSFPQPLHSQITLVLVSLRLDTSITLIFLKPSQVFEPKTAPYNSLLLSLIKLHVVHDPGPFLLSKSAPQRMPIQDPLTMNLLRCETPLNLQKAYHLNPFPTTPPKAKFQVIEPYQAWLLLCQEETEVISPFHPLPQPLPQIPTKIFPKEPALFLPPQKTSPHSFDHVPISLLTLSTIKFHKPFKERLLPCLKETNTLYYLHYIAPSHKEIVVAPPKEAPDVSTPQTAPLIKTTFPCPTSPSQVCASWARGVKEKGLKSNVFKVLCVSLSKSHTIPWWNDFLGETLDSLVPHTINEMVGRKPPWEKKFGVDDLLVKLKLAHEEPSNPKREWPSSLRTNSIQPGEYDGGPWSPNPWSLTMSI